MAETNRKNVDLDILDYYDGKIKNYVDEKASTGGGSYELPIATTEILGGVMVDGTSIIADEQGVISAVGSDGGMELIGSYALTYSGTATSGAAWSDEIELPINLYENNRTLLIGIRDDSRTSIYCMSYQKYTMMKISIPSDIYDTNLTHLISSSYFWLTSSSQDYSIFIQLVHYPETNKLNIRVSGVPSHINGMLIDVYDMGVL